MEDAMLDFKSAVGHCQPDSNDDSTDYHVRLIAATDGKAEYRIDGKVQDTKVSGIFTILVANDEFDGWDWDGTPDLHNDADRLQIVMDSFDILF